MLVEKENMGHIHKRMLLLQISFSTARSNNHYLSGADNSAAAFLISAQKKIDPEKRINKCPQTKRETTGLLTSAMASRKKCT